PGPARPAADARRPPRGSGRERRACRGAHLAGRARRPALARRGRLRLSRPHRLAGRPATPGPPAPHPRRCEPRPPGARARRRGRAAPRRPRDRPPAARRHERPPAARALRRRRGRGADRPRPDARRRRRPSRHALDRRRLAARARRVPQAERQLEHMVGFFIPFAFKSPWLLLFLLLVPVAIGLYLRLDRRRAGRAARWASPALMPNMVGGAPGARRYLPAILFAVALTLLLVGFARPEAKLTEAKDGATVVLMVDVSGSMAANDVKPTRLLAADAAIADFV